MVWATYDVNGDAYFWEVEVLTPGMPPIVKTPAKGGITSGGSVGAASSSVGAGRSRIDRDNNSKRLKGLEPDASVGESESLEDPELGTTLIDDPAHLRIGWSMRQGNLEGPAGYDEWSFGYRDQEGSKCNRSVRNDNYGSSYGPGDVVSLPTFVAFFFSPLPFDPHSPSIVFNILVD